MLNNVQKVTLALTLSCLSDDMSVNIIRVPKLHNKFAMTLTSKDGSFSRTVPLTDTNSIEKFFRDVVNYFYKKVTNNNISYRASQEDIVKDADTLLSGYCLAVEGTVEEQDKMQQKISDCVEFIDDCAKYVNQGSREHLVFKCMSNFLNELFFHISLEDMKESDDFNLEEVLNVCYENADENTKDLVKNWRKNPKNQVYDRYLDMEMARILTYAILAKNVNLHMWNDLSVDNTLKIEFDAGDCDARPSIYLLKSSDKNINFEILKSQVFRSILGKNEIAEYASMDEYQQENLILDIIKENGIDNISVQRFIDFYLNRGLSEVNYGRDGQLIDAILLNISSMLEVGYGKEVSVDCESTRLAEICDIFDDNYSMVDENRKPAILSALAIDNYISGLYK